MKTSTSFWFVALVLSVLSFAGIAQAGLVVFGTGFSLPESISLVPAGFGTFGGDYFIPDPGINALGLGNIDYLPPTGGTASVFVTIPGQSRATVGRNISAEQFRLLGWTVFGGRWKWQWGFRRGDCRRWNRDTRDKHDRAINLCRLYWLRLVLVRWPGRCW